MVQGVQGVQEVARAVQVVRMAEALRVQVNILQQTLPLNNPQIKKSLKDLLIQHKHKQLTQPHPTKVIRLTRRALLTLQLTQQLTRQVRIVHHKIQLMQIQQIQQTHRVIVKIHQLLRVLEVLLYQVLSQQTLVQTDSQSH